jgi:hypothetical protein
MQSESAVQQYSFEFKRAIIMHYARAYKSYKAQVNRPDVYEVLPLDDIACYTKFIEQYEILEAGSYGRVGLEPIQHAVSFFGNLIPRGMLQQSVLSLNLFKPKKRRCWPDFGYVEEDEYQPYSSSPYVEKDVEDNTWDRIGNLTFLKRTNVGPPVNVPIESQAPAVTVQAATEPQVLSIVSQSEPTSEERQKTTPRPRTKKEMVARSYDLRPRKASKDSSRSHGIFC